ncbi:MAG: hypothetical protein WBQ03_13335, partial [Candidatus Sulfotelmatobacter sp.]
MALTKEAREFFAKEGRKGGKAAARSMTPEQRKESARRAARARWAKVTKEKERATADTASARQPVTLK